MLTYERYKSGFWAVYEDDALLCVTVYLKGALSVIERISGVRPDPPTRKKRAPLPPKYRPEPFGKTSVDQPRPRSFRRFE